MTKSHVNAVKTSSEPAPSKKRRRWWLYLLLFLIGMGLWLWWEMRRIYPDEPNMYFAKSYQPPALTETLRPKPPCPTTKPGQKRVYWGDLHVHTSYSVDAYSVGTRNDPRDAYAFAQGKTLPLADRKATITIDRPLDFMAVTDHAEYFAAFSACFHPDFRNRPVCMGFRNLSRSHRYLRVLLIGILGQRDMMSSGKPKQPIVCLDGRINCQDAMINTWKHVQAAAQQAYQRCRFTTFIGYEWTATPGGSHVHRNVIFANAHVPQESYDFIRYPKQRDLWKALDKGCRSEQGCQVLTIPHNTNWSDGLSLQLTGGSEEEHRLRAKYDRLVEIHQAKGNSECLNPYGDDRGDCDFEISINPMSEALAKGNWYGLKKQPMTKQRWEKIRSSYVRSALQRGLRYYETSGRKLNPLQLGLIGSTDTHNGTPGAVALSGFSGSHGDLDVTTSRRLANQTALETNPGGIVAVWAEENTRESVFAALNRRETYATSGPRIRLRFFQTWDTQADLCAAGSHAQAQTVMGGTLQKPPAGVTQPRFVIQTVMDRTRLARIDIVTARLQAGKVIERVLRFPAKDTKQGDATMCQVWTDPAFDKDSPTYWYARILEQPTPRWSLQDCKKLGKCDKIAAKYKRMVQQRAWSSPIWHHP